MVLSFSGGILAGHGIPCHSHWIIACLYLAVITCLVTLLFFPAGPPKATILLLVFFFAGALLIQGKPSTSRLIPLATQNEGALIEGTVLEPVKIVDNKIGRFTLYVDTLCLPEETVPLHERIAVTVYRHLPALRPGDRIRFPARLRLFRNFRNPGNYDYEGAMKRKGLTCAASVSDGGRIIITGSGDLPFLRGFVERLQRPVRGLFHSCLTARNAALFRALILGERQGITTELREPFNQTGLGHLLAVSGLHIGLVAGVVFFLFKWALSRSYRLTLCLDVRKLAALLTCLPVVGYALLAGFQVSSQRAMIMALAFLGSLILGREREVWSTLSLAGLIILVFDPNALFSISFQLSFMAVVGILWLTPVILTWLRRMERSSYETSASRNRLLDYLIGLTAVSAAAVFFLLPLTCHYFHRISLVSLPANLTTVPILGMWIIPFGLLSALIVPFSTGIAGFFLHIGAWGLNIMMSIIEFWANLPGSSIWTVTPNSFEILLFYSIIFFTFFFKRFRWAKTALVVVGILILGDIAYWVHTVRFNKNLEVVFLDVGRGNAALVSFPGGKKMLIDGGGFASSSFDVGRMVVAPYLWHSKILRIDYLVLSHPQADHMNGLRFIARFFHPKEFWHNGDKAEMQTYRELMDIVEKGKICQMLPMDLKGDIQINGARVRVLHPGPGMEALRIPDDNKRLNNNSLVLKITYGRTSFLFPGDLEKAGEDVLMANAGQMIQSDVLLCPHHGSKTSSSKRFLTMVKPSLCIISSGERIAHRFPHQTVLDRLRKVDCDVIQTARAGAVTVSASQDRVDLRTFVDGRQDQRNHFHRKR